MKFFAFLLCFLGAVLMYCSHSNQALLKQPLSKKIRYLGALCIFLAFLTFLMLVPKLVAVFMWLMTILVAWSFLPFIPLLQRYISHEVSKSAKDSA